MPFKAHAAGRHHIPKQRLPGDELARVRRQLASARELDGLVHGGGDRGLARGASRARPGAGSPGTAPLAILTALTLRTVFRLALRQTEGLIGSILHPARPRACRAGPHDTQPPGRDAGVPRSAGGHRALQLLVDSTGLKLGGPGEWLVEKHGTKTRRVLAQAAPGRGCRDRPDRGRGADQQRRR